MRGKSSAAPGAQTARSAFSGRRESSKASARFLVAREALRMASTTGVRSSADWNATTPLDTHAVLYRHNQWEDLNRMIPVDSGWELNIAQAINDRGEIAGTGTIHGASHAFLLKQICPQER
jgi:hypothetical protein